MTASIIDGTVPRLAPKLTDENRAYWTGGAKGQLLIQRCQRCGRWTHPPTDTCPSCDGELKPEPVSGKGSVFTFTVNKHQFHPDVPPPNTIAIVQLVEQDDLRIPTNLVGIEEADLRVGIPVQVLFERQGEMYYPVFEPTRSAD
jgi:uncharacterized OB-fold protein